jgi:hypothetical protein
VIIGSGSLARGIGYALSRVSTGPLRVAIIGRSVGKVSRMAVIANARAASFGAPATFSALGFPEFKALAVFASASFSQAEGRPASRLAAVAVGARKGKPGGPG